VQKYTIVSKEYDNNNENLSVDHIREMIKEVGRVPVQRDIHYNAIG
jgi:2-iminoacetate synthase ThiH